MGDPVALMPAGTFCLQLQTPNLTAVPHFDPTITVATLIAVLVAILGGHRAFCRLEAFLSVLTEQFGQHQRDDDSNFRRVDDRLDQQRDLIHAVDSKVERLSPVKRTER